MNHDVKAFERHVTNELVASFERQPDAWTWRDADCDAIRGPNGIYMSVMFFTVYQPAKVKFGFWNRCRIKRAFKRWRASTGKRLADAERRKALVALSQCLSTHLRAVA